MKKNKKILIIIPARMGSSRFPGKPLKKINGKTMIQMIHDTSIKSNLANYIAVATCDKKIFDHIKNIGGNVVMTSKKHERASDRCAEGMIKLEKRLNIKFDIIVMIQGDEPMITKQMIDSAIKPFFNDENLLIPCTPIPTTIAFIILT